jgi:hypothetical protein
MRLFGKALVDDKCVRDAIDLAVEKERRRQDEKFGPQDGIPNGTGDPHYGVRAVEAKLDCAALSRLGTLTFAAILKEEFYEALAEKDPSKLRTELIQVMAVAKLWVEVLDREHVSSREIPV